MRIIMAVSSDGFVARGPDDDMSWTGDDDKALFRVLTSVGGVCAAGSRTYDLMGPLSGRHTVRLSRGLTTLEVLHRQHPRGIWLIGGLTVAVEALSARMVEEVHLSRVGRQLVTGVEAFPMLRLVGERPDMRTRFGDVVHEVYRVR